MNINIDSHRCILVQLTTNVRFLYGFEKRKHCKIEEIKHSNIMEPGKTVHYIIMGYLGIPDNTFSAIIKTSNGKGKKKNPWESVIYKKISTKSPSDPLLEPEISVKYKVFHTTLIPWVDIKFLIEKNNDSLIYSLKKYRKNTAEIFWKQINSIKPYIQNRADVIIIKNSLSNEDLRLNVIVETESVDLKSRKKPIILLKWSNILFFAQETVLYCFITWFNAKNSHE